MSTTTTKPTTSKRSKRPAKLERHDPLWIKCNGEAHSNPFIDNCGQCAPWWEYYPVCFHHSVRLVHNKACTAAKCPTCRQRWTYDELKASLNRARARAAQQGA